jgi:hypothetical protein
MHLVEQDRGNTGQFGVGLDAGEENASVRTRMRVRADRLVSSRVA